MDRFFSVLIVVSFSFLLGRLGPRPRNSIHIPNPPASIRTRRIQFRYVERTFKMRDNFFAELEKQERLDLEERLENQLNNINNRMENALRFIDDLKYEKESLEQPISEVEGELKKAEDDQEVLAEGNLLYKLFKIEQIRFWSEKKRELETRYRNLAKAIEAHTQDVTEILSKQKEEIKKDLREYKRAEEALDPVIPNENSERTERSEQAGSSSQ